MGKNHLLALLAGGTFGVVALGTLSYNFHRATEEFDRQYPQVHTLDFSNRPLLTPEEEPLRKQRRAHIGRENLPCCFGGLCILGAGYAFLELLLPKRE